MLIESLTLFYFTHALQVAKSLKWLFSARVVCVVAAGMEEEQLQLSRGSKGTECSSPLMEFVRQG